MRFLLKKLRLLQILLSILIITFIIYVWICFTLPSQHATWSNSWLLRKNQGGYINCSPQSNIVFLKTHKCCSSTIQNIFMRYGYVNHKIFVLPQEHNYLGYKKRFTKKLVPDPKTFNASYNILTHHTRLEIQETQSLMPNDTIFVSIVRNPVLLFESLFGFYNLRHIWNFEFDKFNDENWDIPENVFTVRFHDKYGINQMMHDMGLDTEFFNDERKILSYIDELDSIFSLVMVSERLDESLILLKDLLCWSYDDVIVFNANARNEKYKTNITDLEYQRIEELNKADTLLYKHFSRKFDARVKAFGEDRMKEEVKILKKKTEMLFKDCVKKTDTKGKTIQFVIANKNNITCKLITTDELKFTNLIRKEQVIKHPGSVFLKM